MFHWRRHCQVGVTHVPAHLGILITGEVEEKQELKKLSLWGEFSFHVMVDHEIFTNVKNEK